MPRRPPLHASLNYDKAHATFHRVRGRRESDRSGADDGKRVGAGIVDAPSSLRGWVAEASAASTRHACGPSVLGIPQQLSLPGGCEFDDGDGVHDESPVGARRGSSVGLQGGADAINPVVRRRTIAPGKPPGSACSRATRSMPTAAGRVCAGLCRVNDAQWLGTAPADWRLLDYLRLGLVTHAAAFSTTATSPLTCGSNRPLASTATFRCPF